MNPIKTPKIVTLPLLCALSLLGACSSNDDNGGGESNPALSIDMRLPDSLTGGKAAVVSNTLAMSAASAVSASSADVPCSFTGADDEEPFRNGYEMTKFMVSVVATWGCISDTVIALSTSLPDHEGSVIQTDNDTLAADYDYEEPTHYSVTDDNGSQTTVRLYYGFDRATPPTSQDLPGIYLSWDGMENDDIQGKLIIDSEGLDAQNPNPEDPIKMRMDFNNGVEQKLTHMYLQFAANSDVEGFHIEVTKDLTARSGQVYTARGLIAMNTQFNPTERIVEVPNLMMYTVADAVGNGAAIAEFSDLALPLALNTDNHLGDYLFSKQDIYYFDADQTSSEPWDYIHKSVTSAIYRGGRTTLPTGGSFEPDFNPSLDLIIDALGLDADYFTDNKCAVTSNDCLALLNAIFEDGFAGQEQNQGVEPSDWRFTALGKAEYLNSVYPLGYEDWTNVFIQSFSPEI